MYYTDVPICEISDVYKSLARKKTRNFLENPKQNVKTILCSNKICLKVAKLWGFFLSILITSSFDFLNKKVTFFDAKSR